MFLNKLIFHIDEQHDNILMESASEQNEGFLMESTSEQHGGDFQELLNITVQEEAVHEKLKESEDAIERLEQLLQETKDQLNRRRSIWTQVCEYEIKNVLMQHVALTLLSSSY